jgi:penicillin-binding protein 2
MNIENPFTIRESISKVKGFSRMREEGTDFWVSNYGKKIYSSLSSRKIQIIFSFIVLFAFSLLARSFWLQVVSGSEYSLIAEGNRIRLSNITAERGIIYDRFNTPLVANTPNFSLYLIPGDLPKEKQQRDIIFNYLSPIIVKDTFSIEEIYNSVKSSSYQPLVIVENLSHDQAVALSVIEDDLPGINLGEEPRRKYNEGSGLSHVLGYVGKISQVELDQNSQAEYGINDYIGKDGIEKYYEYILRGRNGIEEIEVDAMGKPKKILNQKEPVSGQSIVLTIDQELQTKLSQSLAAAVSSSKTSSGAVAIAIEPESGEVLALVSYPGFDNNFFSAGIDKEAYSNYLNDPAEPLFNRAISGLYPPGSTFKPIVALAALEQNIIDESKTFLSTGGLQINRWFFPDWKYGGHGRINVTTALAESVNTFFYYIGGGYSDFEGLGINRIVAFAERLFLNRTLGIDLPGEASGFLPSKSWKEEVKGEPWYIGDTYHLSIGQGDILVSPLQVAAYTAAIANGGTLYQPHLLKDIKGNSPQNQIDSEVDQYVLAENFASNDNIDIIRRGLRKAVTSGSARSLSYLPVSSAGKTGTAQVGGDKETHAWFTGFAPYESPRIVLTILVENGGEGSSVAVPIFRDIIEWYFSEE